MLDSKRQSLVKQLSPALSVTKKIIQNLNATHSLAKILISICFQRTSSPPCTCRFSRRNQSISQWAQQRSLLWCTYSRSSTGSVTEEENLQTKMLSTTRRTRCTRPTPCFNSIRCCLPSCRWTTNGV